MLASVTCSSSIQGVSVCIYCTVVLALPPTYIHIHTYCTYLDLLIISDS